MSLNLRRACGRRNRRPWTGAGAVGRRHESSSFFPLAPSWPGSLISARPHSVAPAGAGLVARRHRRPHPRDLGEDELRRVSCSGLLDLLLPGRCASCGLPGDPLCRACRADLTPLSGPRCRRCGHPQGVAVERCPACRRVPPDSRQALAWAGPARDLILDLKDAGVRAAAGPLAELLVAYTPPPAGLLVPVPASGEGRSARGFDQSEVIARAAARSWGCEAMPLLVRRAGPRQRGAPLRQRLSLGPHAFAPSRGPVPGEGPVVLIDDVVTTGSSLAAAAGALRAAGWRIGGTRACARVLRTPGRR